MCVILEVCVLDLRPSEVKIGNSVRNRQTDRRTDKTRNAQPIKTAAYNTFEKYARILLSVI